MFVRILVVEDHAVLAREVATGLRRDGFAVDIARDGEEAIEKSDVNDYDVVVLDRDLPKVHGDDVCQARRGAVGRAEDHHAHCGGVARRHRRRAEPWRG